MSSYIIIGQALVIAVLAVIIISQRIKHINECEELVIALEDEQILRDVEKACWKIFFDHHKKEQEKEIAKLEKEKARLEEILHASEKKRKELCTRLWEEENLK